MSLTYHWITGYQFISQEWFPLIVRTSTKNFPLVNRRHIPFRNEDLGFRDTILSVYLQTVSEKCRKNRRCLWSSRYARRSRVPDSPSPRTYREIWTTSRKEQDPETGPSKNPTNYLPYRTSFIYTGGFRFFCVFATSRINYHSPRPPCWIRRTFRIELYGVWWSVDL